MGCGSSAPADVNPHQIDSSHFQFGKVVGKGGFGKVNAAMRVENMAEIVAIKRIQKRAVLEPALCKSVWMERDVMSRVRSAFLLNVMHTYQDQDELFLVMPFMRGGDLDYYLEVHGAMLEDVARFYLAQIVLAMEDLHSLDYVYRDLKPQNCLFHESGHLALSDYGLCVALSEKNKFQAVGASGTPGYMAPEVVSGKPYGFSCDFFSFGVTMYVLLTNKHGLFGERGSDFSRSISYSGLSREAEDLVRRLLTLDPRRRFGCAEQTKEPRLSEAKESASEPPAVPIPGTAMPGENGSPELKYTVPQDEDGPVELLAEADEDRPALDRTHSLTSKKLTGWAAVKAHPFFRGIDWDKMAAKEIPPPYVPKLKENEVHCSNRHSLIEYFELEDDGKKRQPPLTPDQQKLFKGFEFNVEVKHPIAPGVDLGKAAKKPGKA